MSKTKSQAGAVPRLTEIQTLPEAFFDCPCFTANLHFGGKVYRVANNGHGGGNRYAPQPSPDIMAALDRWAASTFPPIESCGGLKLLQPMPMTFETWTFEQAMGADPKAELIDCLRGLLDEIDRCGVKISPELETRIRAAVTVNER